MATYTKRSYQSWRVSVATLTKAFDAPAEARAYAQQLIDLGHKEVQTKVHQSTGWQVRIRSQLAPHLTKTFPTKAAAQAWAQAREGEIVKRQFVDYRQADRVTLGDLLRRYDEECLAARPPHDPDRSRIRKLCRHPITLIRMSAIQPADFPEFREQRLRGGFVEPKIAGRAAVVWPAIKGTSVKRELDLMSSIISHARHDWKVHIAINPAAAQNTSRPDKAPGDERNRRPRKKSVTDKTVQARALKRGQPVRKARLRPTGGLWAIISFAIDTAMRCGEMVQLRWSHVHLDHGNGFLELPWTITKNKKTRIVLLSLRARRILLTRAKRSEFVFATNQNTIKLDFAHAGRNVSLALPENLTIDSTAAIDSLQMGFIPNNKTSFKKSDEPDFDLDFLTSRGRTEDAPIHIARLGLTMQPLRFMGLSLEDPMRCTLLTKNGPIVVNIPRPQRYALHKLLVYGERPQEQRTKANKDIIQAAALIDYLLANDPVEIGQLWIDVNDLGPGWRRRLDQGYKAMGAAHPECDFDARLQVAIAQALET